MVDAGVPPIGDLLEGLVCLANKDLENRAEDSVGDGTAQFDAGRSLIDLSPRGGTSSRWTTSGVRPHRSAKPGTGR
jgi:hypothetical protein